MSPDDEAYLVDIGLAARRLTQLSAGVDKPTFDASEIHQLAIMKLLQDIGEAASRLSIHARQAIPEVPWRQVVGLRHHLVHDYGGVDLDLIWATLQTDIDPLLTAIERFLPPESRYPPPPTNR